MNSPGSYPCLACGNEHGTDDAEIACLKREVERLRTTAAPPPATARTVASVEGEIDDFDGDGNMWIIVGVTTAQIESMGLKIGQRVEVRPVHKGGAR